MRFRVSALFTVLGAGAFLLLSGFILLAKPGPSGSYLFKQTCSMCHGPHGKGYAAIKTPDFTDPKVQASMTDKEIMGAIKNGKKGTFMPTFVDKLKEEEIHSLLTYIRSLDSSKKPKH
jgi:cytochrome c oxidase cbb3-type subunit 3